MGPLIILWIISWLGIGWFFVSKKGNIQPYKVQKRDIKRVYSSLLSDIKVDMTDNKIDWYTIENIGNDIVYFEERIIKLQKAFLESTNSINEWERKWLIKFSLNFINVLNHWLEFHSKELTLHTEKLEQIWTESQNYNLNWNLLLHKKLVEKQIEEIKHIKR